MMSFLVVPFVFLGTLATLTVWGLSRYRRVKNYSPETGNHLNHTTLSKSIILTVITSGILGLFLRLYGFSRSLWLDEFGTLWTIDGSFLQVIERSFSFQGQSPFYYSIVWAFVQIFGVSENSVTASVAAVRPRHRIPDLFARENYLRP